MPGRSNERTPHRKAGRLSRSAEFDRVYRHGRSVANRYLILYAFPREDEGELRCGLSVGRKVGSAVERNQLKRLLREALAATDRSNASAPCDLVVVARPELRELAQAEGLGGISAALEELLQKSSPLSAGAAQ